MYSWAAGWAGQTAADREGVDQTGAPLVETAAGEVVLQAGEVYSERGVPVSERGSLTKRRNNRRNALNPRAGPARRPENRDQAAERSSSDGS